MSRLGRKSTLTKAIQDKVVKILEAGNYQRVAFESLGIPKDTFYYWLREGEKAEKKEGKLTKTEQSYVNFLNAVKKAEQVAMMRNVKVIQDAAKKNWQAAAWYLERKAPDEFGRRDRVQHSGDKNNPPVFHVVWDDGTDEDIEE